MCSLHSGYLSIFVFKICVAEMALDDKYDCRYEKDVCSSHLPFEWTPNYSSIAHCSDLIGALFHFVQFKEHQPTCERDGKSWIDFKSTYMSIEHIYWSRQLLTATTFFLSGAIVIDANEMGYFSAVSLTYWVCQNSLYRFNAIVAYALRAHVCWLWFFPLFVCSMRRKLHIWIVCAAAASPKSV